MSKSSLNIRTPYEAGFEVKSPAAVGTPHEQVMPESVLEHAARIRDMARSPYYDPRIASRKQSFSSMRSDMRSPPLPVGRKMSMSSMGSGPRSPPPAQFATRKMSMSSVGSEIRSPPLRTSAIPTLRDTIGAHRKQSISTPSPQLSVQRQPSPLPTPLFSSFGYTSGRFLVNEQAQLEQRTTTLNIDALKAEVVRCVGGDRHILSVSLYCEGHSSRYFHIVLNDGDEVLVKIPYKSKPRHYATASEVATMTLLRAQGLPVPKVYGWCSRAEASPVGVEFIIMEAIGGASVESQLSQMDKVSIETLAHTVVDVERFLFNIPFAACGSIYFIQDVPADWRRDLLRPEDMSRIKDADRYCIGPSTEPHFWRGLSSELTEDHGPWDTPAEYMVSLGYSQLRHLVETGQSVTNMFPYNSMFEEATSPDERRALLDKYLSIAMHIMPGSLRSGSKSRPMLRHPNLTGRKLIMSQSIHNTTYILNWRYTTILPLAIASGYPTLFHPPDLSEKMSSSLFSSTSAPPTDRPKLPKDYKTFENDVFLETLSKHRAELLCHFYYTSTSNRNATHAQLLHDPTTRLLRRLCAAIRAPWVIAPASSLSPNSKSDQEPLLTIIGNGPKASIPLKGALIRLSQNWHHFGPSGSSSQHGQPSPRHRPSCLSFDKSEIRQQREDESLLEDAEELVRYIMREIGVTDEETGWIANSHYRRARRRNAELKTQWIEEAEGDVEGREKVRRGWMFGGIDDDQNYIDDGEDYSNEYREHEVAIQVDGEHEAEDVHIYHSSEDETFLPSTGFSHEAYHHARARPQVPAQTQAQTQSKKGGAQGYATHMEDALRRLRLSDGSAQTSSGNASGSASLSGTSLSPSLDLSVALSSPGLVVDIIERDRLGGRAY